MNRNDDFDNTLEAWLRGQAPSQAPDRVLDAALDRVAAQSQKRSRLQRLIGGTHMATLTRVAAVTAVVAVAVLVGFQLSNLMRNVGPAPSPSPSVSAEPSESAIPSSFEPSAGPSSAGLVLRLEGGAEDGRFHLVTILEDGRVITTAGRGTAGPATPPFERRLTAAGVQLVRDEMNATGLTDASATYYPVAKPGVEPPPYGGAGSALEVGLRGGGTASIFWFFFGGDGLYFEPQPEALALDALAARLQTLEEWLPASAWADASPKAYSPAQYRIVISTDVWGGSVNDLPVESSTVAWPLEAGIDTFGDVIAQGSPEIRCGLATFTEGAAVIDALETAGAAPPSEPSYLSFQVGLRAASRLITIALEPVIPFFPGRC